MAATAVLQDYGRIFAQAADGMQPQGGTFGSSLIKKVRKERQERRRQPDLSVYVRPPAVPADPDAITVDTVLVAADIMVMDKNDRPIHGLSRSAFRVFEDGVAQEVALFAIGSESSHVPRSIVLVLDHSSSQLPYIQNSLEAAKVLIDKLNPNDRLAIVTDDVEILSGFTSDKTQLKSVLDKLAADTFAGKLGLSKQCSALLAVLNEMFRGDEMRPIVIFQTDGDEFPKQALERSPVSISAKEIRAAAERSGVTVYTVIPGPGMSRLSGDDRSEQAILEIERAEQLYMSIKDVKKVTKGKPNKDHKRRYANLWADARSRDEEAISEIANSTGGLSQYLETPERANDVYNNIFNNLAERYLIGYYPTNANRDGKLRKLSIEIQGRTDYKIVGRKTYTPPNDGSQ